MRYLHTSGHCCKLQLLHTHTHTTHVSLCVWHVNVANDCCTLLPSDISIFHILSEHHTPPLPWPLLCPVPTNDTSDDVDVGSTNCSQLKIVAILSLISLIVAESVGGQRKCTFIVHTLQKAAATCVCMGYASVCVYRLLSVTSSLPHSLNQTQTSVVAQSTYASRKLRPNVLDLEQ